MDSLLQFDGLSERLSGIAEEYPDPNNNSDYDSTSTTPKGDKYSLRPRSMRRVTENLQKSLDFDEKTKSTSKAHKPKQKPAPLSKYRRKTANARERNRMREINQAFEALRSVIPQMATAHSHNNEKLTKITTLRLAMKYISALSATLSGSEGHQQHESFSDYSDLDCLLLESDGESLPLSDSSLLASPDFPEPSLSPVDFTDPSLPALLHTDFTEHALDAGDFGDFLLT